VIGNIACRFKPTLCRIIVCVSRHHLTKIHPVKVSSGVGIIQNSLDKRLGSSPERMAHAIAPPAPASRRPGGRAVAARAGAASKVTLARNRRAVPRAGFAANEGSAARESSVSSRPSRAGERSEHAAGALLMLFAAARARQSPCVCMGFAGAARALRRPR